MKFFILISLLISTYVYAVEDAKVNWKTKDSSDWEIQDAVLKLESELPSQIQKLKDAQSSEDLLKGATLTYIAPVTESPKSEPETMAVELSRRLFNISLKNFLQQIPAHDWGKHLAHLVKRGIAERSVDENGRVNMQVERMVLGSPLQNMDMTKVERIEYENDKVTVYWRVRYSDNGTTRSDIGKVEFKELDGKTLVTFHSAHRLSLFKIPLASSLVHKTIGETFLGHLESYNKLMLDCNCL